MLETNEEFANQFSPETPPPREQLTDAEMSTLLTAFGNHEGKTIAVGGMKRYINYTQASLKDLLRNLQGDKPDWDINGFSWCKDSFEPNSLMEVVTTDTNIAFQTTEYCENVGKPLAGLLLHWSLLNPQFSLNQIFGSSQSPRESKSTEEIKNTSPGTRLKILRALVGPEFPQQTLDIAKQLDRVTSSVGMHLRALSDNQIINYDPIDPSQPHVRYKLNLLLESIDQLEYPERLGKSLPKNVYGALQAMPNHEWTIEEISRYLVQQGLRKENKYLQQSISKVLSIFKKADIVNQGKFEYGNYSEITINPHTFNSISELITILDLFQNQDPNVIKLGNQMLENILSNPEHVSTLMRKIYEASSYTHKVPKTENIERIISIIRTHPNCSTRDIREAFVKKYGKIGAGMASITSFLTAAWGENRLIRTDNGSNSYWNLN